MLGSQTLVLSIIGKALSTFLVVDRKDIEGKLLAAKGNCKLQNVEVKPQRVPYNAKTSLIITGSVKEIDVKWDFSAKGEKKLTSFTLSGIRIRVSFETTEWPSSPRSPRSPQKHNGHFFSFFHQIMQELQDLQSNISKSISESEFVQDTVQQFLDTINLRCVDVEVAIEVLLPSSSKGVDGRSEGVSNENPKLVTFTAHALSFVTEHLGAEIVLAGAKRPPIKLRLDCHSVSANLHQEGNISPPFPILEPCTYVMFARRVTGSRFLDMTTGFQILGSILETEQKSKENEDNSGLVLHLGSDQIQALQALSNILTEDSGSEDVGFDDHEGSEAHKRILETRYISSATPALIVIASFWLLWKIADAMPFLDPLKKIMRAEDNILPVAIVIVVLACLIMEVSMGLYMSEKFDAESNTELDALYGSVYVPEKRPATYRLPMRYITVHAADGMHMNMFDASITGRIDGKVVNIAAERFDLRSLNTDLGPRLSSSGIRGCMLDGEVLFNVDETHEIFIPGQVQTTQPIRGTVLRFQNGKVTMKVNEVQGQIIRGKDVAGIAKEKHRFFRRKKTPNSSSDTESGSTQRTINGEIRKGVQVAGELTESISTGVQEGVKTGVKTATKATEKATNTLVGGVKKMAKATKNFTVACDDKLKGKGTLASSLEKGAQKVVDLADEVNPFAQDYSRTLPMDGHSIQLRHVINRETQESTRKLRLIALQFETIPLQKNRYNVRAYPNTFRGSNAVDFMLKTNLATSRQNAVHICRNLQAEFSLFQHVTREFKFRDEYDCVYHFTEVKKRRAWKESSTFDLVTQGLIYEWDEDPMLPFPIEIECKQLVLKHWQDQQVALDVKDALVVVTPGSSNSRVLDCTVFINQVQNHMIKMSNARIRAKVHPDLPGEVHGFQFGVDYLKASPGYTAQDWFDKLGFNSEDSSPSEAISLPYAYISPFSLHLRFDGILINTQEAAMMVEEFDGNESTSSTHLIVFFVKKVLGRAPGIVGNMRVMGVNLTESAGLATTASVASKLVPFGQYIGIVAFAGIDAVTGAIDAGKAARDDPYGTYKPGDMARGIIYSAKAAARTGAKRRGKPGLYDMEDEVAYNPVDFAIGTAEGTSKYMYGNKARFAGGTVAAATMIGTAVVAGPVGGILLGIVAGAATEWTVKRVEEKVEPNSFNENDDYGDEYSVQSSTRTASSLGTQ